MARRITPAAIAGLLLMLSGCVSTGRDHVYLTWQGDTSTTMTVNFHTDAAPLETTVFYDTEPHGAKLRAYPNKAKGTAAHFASPKGDRYINSVELTGLEPGATYYFAIGKTAPAKPGPQGEYKFRTIPDNGADIRFITGGDMGAWARPRMLLAEAAQFDPLFGVVGGDIPYANGKRKNVHLWDRWLNNWQDTMVTSDGCLVPMVLAIGNHETNDEYSAPLEKAPFYYAWLPQGGKTYFARQFGPDVALFVLDSDHIVPHAEQAAWLAQQLEQHENAQHKFAVYHVPLYPSHRDFDGGNSAAGREHWLPLFDQYRLEAAFENHDHTHKRSKPLRNNEVAEGGTVYFGDGCFGVPARSIDNKGAWYLETASSTPHFWVVEVSGADTRYRAVDVHGQVFDSAATRAPAQPGK